MPIVDFGRIDSDVTMEELIDAFGKVQKALDYLMQGGLDSKNAREFGGWLVGLTELQSRDKTVGMSTEDTGADDIRFWAGDVKTGQPNFKVTQAGILTAIAAVLMSAAGYPRVEINGQGNLFAAYQDADSAIRIVPTRSLGSPAIEFYSGGSAIGYFQDIYPDLAIVTIVGTRSIQLSSGSNLKLFANNDIEMSGERLKMNGSLGYNGTVSYVKNVVSDGAGGFTALNGSMTFTNGILTSVT